MKANRAPVRSLLTLSAILAPILAIAACVGPTPAPPPPPRPAPPPPPRVVAPAPADWRDAPQTPGTWRWRMDGDRSVAEYATYAAAPVAKLICEPLSQTTILWRNSPATGPMPLTVTTTGARRLLTATPDGAGGASASLRAGDPVLDALAFSRGRFMVEMQGAPPLYLPAWPELSRVIEDCRQRLETGVRSGLGGAPDAGRNR